MYSYYGPTNLTSPMTAIASLLPLAGPTDGDTFVQVLGSALGGGGIGSGIGSSSSAAGGAGSGMGNGGGGNG